MGSLKNVGYTRRIVVPLKLGPTGHFKHAKITEISE